MYYVDRLFPAVVTNEIESATVADNVENATTGVNNSSITDGLSNMDLNGRNGGEINTVDKSSTGRKRQATERYTTSDELSARSGPSKKRAKPVATVRNFEKTFVYLDLSFAGYGFV